MAATVRKQLGAQANIKSLSDLDNIELGKNVVVIGTLFKIQNLKRNKDFHCNLALHQWCANKLINESLKISSSPSSEELDKNGKNEPEM